MSETEHMDASLAQESNETRKSSSPKQNILEAAIKFSESVYSEPSEQKHHSENEQHEPEEINPVLSNCIVTKHSGLPPEEVSETILGLLPADVTEDSLTDHLGLPLGDAIKGDGTEQSGVSPEVVAKSSCIEKLGQSGPPPENVAQHSRLDQSGSTQKDSANKRTANLVKRKYKLRSSVGNSRVLRSRSQEKPIAPQPGGDNLVNASTSRERKRRKKKRMEKTTADEFVRIKTHLRYLLNRMSYEQNLIDAYSTEGWKGQSVEKLKPEKELQRASSEISRRKLKIRDLFQHLDSLLTEGRFPESLFDSEGQIDSEDIFCAKCGSKDISTDDDIILCDGACDRGFHLFCLEPPLLKEEIPPDDEGWLCPACDCKVDCVDLLNETQGLKLSVTDSWEKVFPEAAAAGNNQDNRNGSSSDDSEDNDYDPDCPEVDGKGQGDESSFDKSGESDESDESDFTSASNDMVVPPNDKQCLGLPSDDSEDNDYDPDGPEIDEQVDQGTSSSDFSSDSEDFSATLDHRNFSDKEDDLDGQRRLGRKKKETLRDEVLSVLESSPGQDNAPLSATRHVERLDYKKLYDEAYGNVSSGSSDDEDWTENIIPRKRKNLSGNVASASPNGNALITENGINSKDIKHDSAGHTPKRRTRQKLNLESTNDSLPKSHRGSQNPGSTGAKGGKSSHKKLGEAVTERLYKSFQENQYPDRAMKEKFAEELGMTTRQVSKWFENARWSFRHRQPKEASAGKSPAKKDASSSQTDREPEQEVVIKESSHNGVRINESPKAGALEVDRSNGAKNGRELPTDGSHGQNSSTPKSTRQTTKSNHEASNDATRGNGIQNSSTPKSTRQNTKLAGETSEATDGSSRQNSSTPNSKRRKTKSDHEASNQVLSSKKNANRSGGAPKAQELRSGRVLRGK